MSDLKPAEQVALMSDLRDALCNVSPRASSSSVAAVLVQVSAAFMAAAATAGKEHEARDSFVRAFNAFFQRMHPGSIPS